MDIQRLDEIRELFGHNLTGSGIREQKRLRAVALFDRVADALQQHLAANQAHGLVGGDAMAQRVAPGMGALAQTMPLAGQHFTTSSTAHTAPVPAEEHEASAPVELHPEKETPPQPQA